MLTFERANELFRYDPISGKLFWKKTTTNRVKVGGEAGSFCKSTGYINIKVGNEWYTLHRIAILLATGIYDKTVQVDHVDHDRGNNRLSNLRVVSHAENMRNQSLRNTNKTGVTGVCVKYTQKGTKRYTANIVYNYKPIFLGNYDTLEEAAAARREAEIKYGFHRNHGL
nr:MAG TPA: endonuclease [Caudoviricetes sp.]